MLDLIPFNYNSKQVRTISKDGEPWFVAKDICDILDIGNPTMAAARLDDDEVSQTEVIDNIGRSQNTNIINEMGLYNLILRSDKPEAKQFKRWITHDVIPSIRKHGLYAKDELLDNPDLMIEVLQELKREREEKKLLQTENQLLSNQTLKWVDRKVLDAIIKKYGASKDNGKEGFHEAWVDFKKELLYKHSINLKLRITNYMDNSGKKTPPPTLSMLQDDEIPAAISTAVALCKAHGVDISDILGKRN